MVTRILTGDCRDVLKTLPDASVQCCVTSPPYYGLRDYGVAGQIGLEQTPDEYVTQMVAVFREVRRVMRDDGTVWLNLGDSYASSPPGRGPMPGVSGLSGINSEKYQDTLAAGHSKHQGTLIGARAIGLKPKDLIGIPWRVAFALQADGWWLRSDIIWAKRNCMPESVRDRPTRAHEYLFLLTKSERYFYDATAIEEEGEYCGQQLGIVRGKKVRAEAMRRKPSGNEIPGADALAPSRRNKRSVWWVATQPFPDAHFATFPPDLVEPCILAGTSERGCCAACGAPWVRQTQPSERYAKALGRSWHDHESDLTKGQQQVRGENRQNKARDEHGVSFREYVTTGWAPSCRCDAGVVPCTVLDPFGGAGTTGLVADRIGRNAILIELNPTYAAMARNRITRDAGLFAEVSD